VPDVEERGTYIGKNSAVGPIDKVQKWVAHASGGVVNPKIRHGEGLGG
jgi:hypothetical protein